MDRGYCNCVPWAGDPQHRPRCPIHDSLVPCFNPSCATLREELEEEARRGSEICLEWNEKLAASEARVKEFRELAERNAMKLDLATKRGMDAESRLAAAEKLLAEEPHGTGIPESRNPDEITLLKSRLAASEARVAMLEKVAEAVKSDDGEESTGTTSWSVDDLLFHMAENYSTNRIARARCEHAAKRIRAALAAGGGEMISELKRLEAAATEGEWVISDAYPPTEGMVILDVNGFPVADLDIEPILEGYAEKLGVDHWGSTSGATKERSVPEIVANAALIVALRNSAKKMIAVVEAAKVIDACGYVEQIEQWMRDDLRAALAASRKER